jgi:hypothetical protein
VVPTTVRCHRPWGCLGDPDDSHADPGSALQNGAMPRITAARYAAVASTLALLVALCQLTGAASYAAGKIGTAQLRNGAVTSAKIKNGAVTGADVKESSLGRVPTAGSATSAGYADRAGDVNGVTVHRVLAAKGPGFNRPTYAFRHDDFSIELGCSGGSPDLVARTTRSGGHVSTSVAGDGGAAAGQVLYAEIANRSFGPASVFDLLAGGDGNANQVTFVYSNPQGAFVQGTLAVDVVPYTSEPCQVAGFVLAG